MGKALVVRTHFSREPVVLGDLVIAAPIGLDSRQVHISAEGIVVDPVGDIDSAEPVQKLRVPQLARGKQSLSDKGRVGLPAVLLGARKGNDMSWALFTAHPAVQDGRGAAVSAEAGRRDVCRHDLAAALRAGEDGDAEHIVFLGVPCLLVFIGVQLRLAIVAHQLL